MAQKRPETVNIWFLAHIVLLTGTRAVTLVPARVKIVIWAYFLRLWELSELATAFGLRCEFFTLSCHVAPYPP